MKLAKGFVFVGVIVILTIVISVAQVVAAEDRTGVGEKEILIGFYGSLTGPGSEYGKGTLNGGKLVFDEVNEKGGIHGRKIRLVVEDDGTNPSKCVAAAKKLIFRDKVFALWGGVASSATAAALETVKTTNVPNYVPMASSLTIARLADENKSIFQFNLTSTISAGICADYVMKRFESPKRVAIMYQLEDYGITSFEVFKKRLKDKWGLEAVTIQSHRLGDSDFSSQVLKIKEANPEVIYHVAYLKETALFVKQCYDYGLKVPIVGSLGANSPGLLEKMAGKEAAAGIFHCVTSGLNTGRYFDVFKAKYVRKYPKESQRPGIPGNHDLLGYGGGLVFVEGLERAGKDLSREGLVRGLESLKKFDTRVFAPISYSRTKHHGVEGGFFWYDDKDGNPVFSEKVYVLD